MIATDFQEKIVDVDRRFFEIFPEAKAYFRPFAPGEFDYEEMAAFVPEDIFAVLITQLKPGIRERVPMNISQLKQIGLSHKQCYDLYITSVTWHRRAQAAKEHAGRRCQVCNKEGSKTALNAHHRTYERLGNELPEDLIVLCKDCHSLFHNNR